MSKDYYYDLCMRHRGRAVEIRTMDGRCHRGIIESVYRDRVFLRPLGGGPDFGGFGFGFWGLGAGIALGAIAGLTLIPLFWW